MKKKEAPIIERACRGFTLVEIVVALTLLSLLMLGLTTALRSFAQTGERLEAQTLAVDDLRLVSGLLLHALGGASSRSRIGADDQARTLWFDGQADKLTWLGSLPARHGVGGLYYLRLWRSASAGDRGEGGELMLDMIPFMGDEYVPDWTAVDSRVLLDGVDDLAVLYQGVGEAQWQQEWNDATALPGFVRIAVRIRGRSWPPIVAPIENAEARSGLDAKVDEVRPATPRLAANRSR